MTCGCNESVLNPKAEPILDDLFTEEIAEGKLSVQTHKPIRVQAIGAVSKKGSQKLRPITDCSCPSHDSSNSYAQLDLFTFESLDDTATLSKNHCFFSINDVRFSYRHVLLYFAFAESFLRASVLSCK